VEWILEGGLPELEKVLKVFCPRFSPYPLAWKIVCLFYITTEIIKGGNFKIPPPILLEPVPPPSPTVPREK